MATSFNYEGDGATTRFSAPVDYLNVTHIKAYVGEPLAETFAFSYDATTQEVVFDVAPPAPGVPGTDNVRIRRVTPTDAIVDFTTKASIVKDDLNTDSLQALYRIEELEDEGTVDIGAVSDNVITRTKLYDDLREETPRLHDTAVAMIADTSLAIGETVLTGGRTTLSDGGEARYEIVAGGTGTDDGGQYLDLSNGFQAKLIAPIDIVNVRLWGATGDGVTDDTAAITAAIAASDSLGADTVVFPPGTYSVSQIDFTGAGKVYRGYNAILLGNATSATTSILQVKCGNGGTVKDFVIAGNSNENYQTGVHWYTNDLNVHYPGRLLLENIRVDSCLIAMTIGALPTQGAPIPAQNTVQADGTATDAPLSESTVRHFITTNCIRPVYMRQPNGKVTFESCHLVAETAQWVSGGYATPDETAAMTIADNGSEAYFSGGSLEQVQRASGSFINMSGGNLFINGTTVEAVASSFISGNASMRLSQLVNAGLNVADATPFLQVDDGATGRLVADNCYIAGGPGGYTSRTAPMVKTVSGLGAGYSPNLNFKCDFSNVELRDWRCDTNPALIPLTDTRISLANCEWTSLDSNGVRTDLNRVNKGENLLINVVDVSADQITSYPQTAGATSGGWTFAPQTASDSWGSTSVGMPSIEDLSIGASVRLTSVAGQTCTATSPVFPCDPQRRYVIDGFFKENAAAGNIIIRILYFKFDGATPSGTASADVMGTSGGSLFGSSWRPAHSIFTTPDDCTNMQIFVYVDGGTDLEFANLHIGG